MTRWIRIASKIARQGPPQKVYVGAIVIRGGAVLSTAFNIMSTSRDKHAEKRALKPHLDLKGATLIVVRVTAGQGEKMSMPCSNCQEAIKRAGIGKVVYIDRDGEVQIYRP